MFKNHHTSMFSRVPIAFIFSLINIAGCLIVHSGVSSWFPAMSTSLCLLFCCADLLHDVIWFSQTNRTDSLPPRRLMTRLPLRMVQPLNSWAAVTESTTFRPRHTLGHSPAQGVQLSLKNRKEQDEFWIIFCSLSLSHTHANTKTLNLRWVIFGQQTNFSKSTLTSYFKVIWQPC